MSNLEEVPEEIICTEGGRTAAVELLSREVPLRGARAMPVRWTLPQKQRSLIGAWFSWTTRGRTSFPTMEACGPHVIPASLAGRART
jgi:hypothetical protein